MNWIPLTDISQLDDIVAASQKTPVGIFKHSTRCSISVMVKKGIEREWKLPSDSFPVYFLDLLTHRAISNKIAEKFSVEHQSPQFILLSHGKAIYDASHNEIDADEIASKV